jgi:hypothetical protein
MLLPAAHSIVQLTSPVQSFPKGRSAASLPDGEVLDKKVQDFIKAVIVHRCRRAREPRVTRHLARGFRKLFSVTRKAPWELSTEDLDKFLELDSTDSAEALTVAVAKLINENLLSVNCPLTPERRTTLTAQIANGLTSRKSAEKLPEKEALFELARIVFQEIPQSHGDRMRFCATRMLLLTGLRLNEVLMLPCDCLRWEDNVDVVTGRPAGEIGGVTKTLRLRYFAEKHEDGAPDVLVEESQWVPERFQVAISEAVATAVTATAELRTVLANQSAAPSRYPRSDLRWFRTTDGRQLSTADLLFLVVVGSRTALPAIVSEEAPIAPISAPAFYQGLGFRDRRNRGTLFTRYGKTTVTQNMRIGPKSLRHLMNTEFFRLRLPDTVITEHFGRRSVVQSYEYDHRNLAERLSFVRLPETARRILKDGGTQDLVARMVVSGAAAGTHIGRSFRRIQEEHGDEAAFVYLAANSDGFHVTPYGFCINSFSMNPCARHLKCFDNCRHFVASGLEEHRVSLEHLREKLTAMKTAASQKPETTIGRRNQVAHATALLVGVDAALKSQPRTAVFPEGTDHSATDTDLFR